MTCRCRRLTNGWTAPGTSGKARSSTVSADPEPSSRAWRAWTPGSIYEWLPVLNRTPTVILVDLPLMGTVGVGRLLGANGTVHGIYLGIGHPTLTAMVWHVEDHPHVMLAIGDDLTIQLLAGQLEDLLGERLHMRDSDWSEWLPTLAAVCRSIIGTEHSLRFDGHGRI